MKTLIELYDDRPLENVLGTDVFRPERTVYLCPAEIAQDRSLRQKLQDFFAHRGVDCELVFLESSIYYADKIVRQLRRVAEEYDDCALDITGGTDAALFAAGLLCAECDIPVFTYSRKKNSFYSIHNAPFAEERPCTLRYSVEDCIRMAGGALRQGRVDNGILDRYMDVIDPFFSLFLTYRRDWNDIVTYFQRVSQGIKGESVSLDVRGDYTVKGERGSRVSANERALRDLESLGFLRKLDINSESVAFSFADAQIRAWLRDVGSVLELYVYKACLDTGLFQDVRTSAVVDWEGSLLRDGVTNELDVIATRGVTPLFISCKTCDVHTDALNELAILRDRFGGEIARSAIVSAEPGNAPMRRRAQELNIRLIDLEDLLSGSLRERLAALMA